MDKEHVLVCVMAESSAGKDRLVSELCNRNGWTQLCSYTTRDRRNGEGETHRFIDEDFYNRIKLSDQIAAYTFINGNHYFSTIDQLYESDYYIIDPIGLQSLKALHLPNLRIVSVYINVPENVRKERAEKRGDNMDVYRARCLDERQQFRNMKKNMDVDYVVSNLDFAKAYSVLKWVSNAEGVWRNHNEESNDEWEDK